MRRVVVTGLGLVTPLGLNAKQSWTNLINSKCGIFRLEGQEFKDLPSRVAGLISKKFNFAAYGYQSEKYLEPFMRYGIAAAEEALIDSQWTNLSTKQKLQTGVCIGSGIGALDEIIRTGCQFQSGGMKKISPFFVPKILNNLLPGHVSIKHGLMGPSHSASTACATGAHSIGDAMRFIQHGDADVMVCGAAESAVSPIAVAGFCRLKALATKYNDTPELSSRPFDQQRDGFVIAEGAGCLVLEEYEHAKARGVNIYAEIAGYGATSDAFHYTSPSSDGNGAARAMHRAVEVAGLKSCQVDYINCHATSTPQGDIIEARAIRAVFRDSLDRLSISSSKGATGHMLGAAGAVEAIFTILAVKNNIIPPTLNLYNLDSQVGSDLHFVPFISSEKTVDIALTNSFGFG